MRGDVTKGKSQPREEGLLIEDRDLDPVDHKGAMSRDNQGLIDLSLGIGETIGMIGLVHRTGPSARVDLLAKISPDVSGVGARPVIRLRRIVTRSRS